MLLRDWRLALRAPPTYRVGNRTVRFHVHFIGILSVLTLLVLLFYYVKLPSSSSSYYQTRKLYSASSEAVPTILIPPYNFTYPLTKPVNLHGITSYRIGIIADMDTNSLCTKNKNTWKSYFKKGYLNFNAIKESATITWDATDPIELTSSFSSKGRGMELSEIVVFNGRLLTFDDRTGLVYEIRNDIVYPWIILSDGNGNSIKGFKSEWATVKDITLFVGSMGKEWTTSEGEFENYDPMYVKAVNVNGEVKSVNWVENYKKVRSKLSITWPGYMIHESGVWSSEHKKWYFLPRRLSKDKYNETKDEFMGTNVLVSVSEDFNDIQVVEIGELKPTHGFSSFKFIPGTRDSIILALKSEEVNGTTGTYVMAFGIDGKIFMNEEKIPTTFKYEGLEFI